MLRAMTDSKSRAAPPFTAVSFLIRFGVALGLVVATYNPTAYSFVDWFWDQLRASSIGAVEVFVGVVLTVGWLILLRATFNSLGAFGLAVGMAFFAALVWLLVDLGVLAGSGVTFYTWVGLVGLAALLAVGLSWSHIWRRFTGQYTVDDVED